MNSIHSPSERLGKPCPREIVSVLQNGSGLYTIPSFLTQKVCENLQTVILKYQPDKNGSVRCLLDKSKHFEAIAMSSDIADICTTLFDMDYRLSSLGARVVPPSKSDAPEHKHVMTPHIDYPYRNVVIGKDRVSSVYRNIPLGLQVLIPLVDMTLDTGATAYIPGSQCWYRSPEGTEFSELMGMGKGARLLVPAGSATMWSGPLWHAAMPNQSSTNRIMITLLFSPPFINHPHLMRETYSKKYLESCPDRLRTLICLNDTYPLIHKQPALLNLN